MPHFDTPPCREKRDNTWATDSREREGRFGAHRGKSVKDNYTLELSGHQARGLHAALALVNHLMAVPVNTPVFPHLMAEGVRRPLVVAEFKLLHEEILRQIEEQDKA